MAPAPDAPAEIVLGAGLARIDEDRHRPGSYTLVVDGTPQSHVDLDDPTQYKKKKKKNHNIKKLTKIKS